MFTPILAFPLPGTKEFMEMEIDILEKLVVPEWLQYCAMAALALNSVYLLVWLSTFLYGSFGDTRSYTIKSDVVWIACLNVFLIAVNAIVFGILLVNLLKGLAV